MYSQKEIKDLFRSRRAPLTHQRLAAYGELAGRKDHPSAEALYETLRKSIPSLSLATVYKTLKTLHEMGLISRIDSPASQARYDADIETHHHAACDGCGRIEDVYDQSLNRIPAPSISGFRIQGYSVHFRGLCAECAKAAGSKAVTKSRIRRH